MRLNVRAIDSGGTVSLSAGSAINGTLNVISHTFSICPRDLQSEQKAAFCGSFLHPGHGNIRSGMLQRGIRQSYI